MVLAYNCFSHNVYTLERLFLRVLTFDILQIGPKMQDFVPANISCMHYKALEFVELVPFSRTNRKI